MTQRLLLQGYDTIECAYYLAFDHGCLLNFEQLTAAKEALRQLKIRKQKPIRLARILHERKRQFLLNLL